MGVKGVGGEVKGKVVREGRRELGGRCDGGGGSVGGFEEVHEEGCAGGEPALG
jgi:hypothetical protein